MTVIGHEAQQRAFLDAWQSGRMHHAWLFTGPKGIGKATFADAAARFVLSGGAGDTIESAKDSTAEALFAAGSHPDFRRLERVVNERTGKLNAEILTDQIRALQGLLNGTPTLSDWRVVVVDSADELNRSAANAFLKSLEEPPARTLFILVSHSPTRLLPTIRSRCRVLRFQPLSETDTRTVLQTQLPDATSSEIGALADLSKGSPGLAVRFAGLEIEALQRELEALSQARTAAELDRRALTLAKSLAGKTAQPRYEAFIELVPAFIAGVARQRTGPSLARAISLWEKAEALAAEAMPLAHDPQAVAFELSGMVGELARNQN
jgi:DNA polymerase-3 subunit delta'